MPSTVRDHGIVRRMASLPRSIMGGISRAMEDGMGFIGRGRRRNQHTNIPLQPQDHHVPQPHEERAKQEEKIRADRRLREEQDAAYLAALQIDKNSKVNEFNKEKGDKGVASKGSESQPTQILIRFPNGERREHTFLYTNKIQSIFSYIDSLGLPGIGNC
ncbi:hypothetical protein D0Y65_011221 [Glycine soja]|uniref:UBX domain-containing protein n=1 Tax=Glycine soja TaxID=3848 RepID=A0A445KIW6_GLYSO|nr:hypothetical protein D0Y65_011221 [Glycine soja]